MPDTANPKNEESPLSLKRLTNAFAAMLGRTPSEPDNSTPDAQRQVEISTRSITESLLFVGRADNEPLSAEQMAATLREVSPTEVATAVEELNALYAVEGSPYTIAESAAGFRMVLREEFERVRDKFYGKVRQAKLSPAAMEVLSVVAYRQPATARTIDQLRGGKNHALVSGLVRRGLLQIERPDNDTKQPHYVTTDRFLRVFKLKSIDELPQAEEFESA